MTSAAAPVPPVTVLDNRHAPCAVGLIRADERARSLPRGAVLEVLSRDRFAPMEVPLWAARAGHEITLQQREGVWPRRFWRFRVRTSAASPGV